VIGVLGVHLELIRNARCLPDSGTHDAQHITSDYNSLFDVDSKLV
jgi:hypothetical protein